MWKIPTDVPQTSVPNGHTKLGEVTTASSLDEIFNYLEEDGGVIVKGFLTPSEVEDLNKELEPLVGKVQQGSLYSKYSEQLADFHGRKTRRAGGLANYSPVFRDRFIERDLVHDIFTRAFSQDGHAGDYWMSQGTTLFVGGPQEAQVLHRDATSHPTSALLGPDGTEGIVNFLVALSPFTAENGATVVIPGSHKWPFHQKGSHDQTIPATMSPGDALLIGGKIIHGTGKNSTNEERACLQFSAVPSYMTPAEAHPLILDWDMVRGWSKRAQQFVGFRSQYPRNSPGLWTKDYQELALHLKLDDPTPRANVATDVRY